MILVDTSVIIDVIRHRQNSQAILFEDILDKGIPWGINEYIYQEVLQGSKDESEFTRLKEYFEEIPCCFLKFGKTSFERAALIYAFCRKSGITIRSTIDLLIVETAIENDVPLLHNDRDFDNIGQVIRELRQYR
jgi:predicted nucleic acid-binding protein